MFKRIAVSTLILGAVMSVIPAMASAQEFYRGRHEYRVHRFERVHGYYDRFGCWHRY